MKKYDLNHDKIRKITDFSVVLSSLPPEKLLEQYETRTLDLDFKNEREILTTLGKFLFFSCEDIRNNLNLNYSELYSIREKILYYYENDFLNKPFIYVESVTKPEILFDLDKFFTEGNLSQLRYTDDFLFELITGCKSKFPSSILQYQYKIRVEDIINIMNKFPTITLEFLILNVYKLSSQTKNSINSRTLIINLINSGKKSFTIDDMRHIIPSKSDIDKEDVLIDISLLLPSNSYIETLKSVIDYSSNFDDSSIKEKFKTDCIKLLYTEEILTNIKHYRLSSFVKSLSSNRISTFSRVFLNKNQFYKDDYINLYMLNRRESVSVKFDYDYSNEDNTEKLIVELIFSKLLYHKEMLLSRITSFINYGEETFTTLKNYLFEINVSEDDILKLQTYHTIFMGSCLYNCGFISTFLKQSDDDNLINRSIQCFIKIIQFFIDGNMKSETYHRDIMLSSICCSFYISNNLSNLDFLSYFNDILTQKKSISKFSLLGNFSFLNVPYVFSDIVCSQLEKILEHEEHEMSKNDIIKHFYDPYSISFRQINVNITRLLGCISKETSLIISLQFLLVSSFLKSGLIQFHCDDTSSLHQLFLEIIENFNNIEVLNSFETDKTEQKYFNSLAHVDISETELENINNLIVKLSPLSLNKLKRTILDIQIIDEQIYHITGPNLYNIIFYNIPFTNEINPFKTIPLNSFLKIMDFDNMEIKHFLSELENESHYQSSTLKYRSKFLCENKKELMLKNCGKFNGLIEYLMITFNKDKMFMLENLYILLKKIKID